MVLLSKLYVHKVTTINSTLPMISASKPLKMVPLHSYSRNKNSDDWYHPKQLLSNDPFLYQSGILNTCDNQMLDFQRKTNSLFFSLYPVIASVITIIFKSIWDLVL